MDVFIMRKKFNLVRAIEIIGVDRERLFYWISHKRLIKPLVKGKGRGGRTFLSLENLLDLALINELSILGISLETISEFLESTSGRWMLFRKDRKKYEEHGFLMVIDKYGITGEAEAALFPGRALVNQLMDDFTLKSYAGGEAPMSVMIINLWKIIWTIEEKTQTKL